MEVASQTDGDFSAMHIVTCSFNVGDVLRYPSNHRLEATGWITGCTSEPDTCRVETDIQRWDPFDEQWLLYSDGPNVYPSPCSGGKSKAIAPWCYESKKGYNYRAVVYVTIVEDGVADADAKIGPTRQYYCV